MLKDGDGVDEFDKEKQQKYSKTRNMVLLVGFFINLSSSSQSCRFHTNNTASSTKGPR
jgi:hypothetical protein